jgi:hypothetical protein
MAMVHKWNNLIAQSSSSDMSVCQRGECQIFIHSAGIRQRTSQGMMLWQGAGKRGKTRTDSQVNKKTHNAKTLFYQL